MGAFYVSLETELPTANASKGGAAILQNLEALEELIDEMGLVSLYEFISQSPEEYQELRSEFGADDKQSSPAGVDLKALAETEEFKDMMQAFADNPGFGELMQKIKSAESLEDFVSQVLPETPPQEEWYDAQEGVDQLNALLGGMESAPDRFVQPESLKSEIGQLRDILLAAAQSNIRFHYSLD